MYSYYVDHTLFQTERQIQIFNFFFLHLYVFRKWDMVSTNQQQQQKRDIHTFNRESVQR